MRFGPPKPTIIMDGLVINMDVSDSKSHTGTETSIYNTLLTSQSGSINNVGNNDYLSQNLAKFILLDGADDYIELSDTKNSSYSNITIGMWLMGSAGTGGNYLLAAPIDGTAGTFWVNGGNSPKFGIRTTSGYNTLYPTSLSTTQFQYLTGTWDGNNIVFYKNASEVQTKPHTGTLMWSATHNWNIGAYGGPFGAGGLNGNTNFSAFHFYNRALSADEVLHNYNTLKGRFGL
jgi:hypothetical protein